MSEPAINRASTRVPSLDEGGGHAGVLVSHLAHELRTPLHGVLGFAQLMFRDEVQPLDSQQLRYLSLIESAGHDMLALLDDVLNLARAQLDTPPVLQPVDLVEVMHSAADEAHAFAQARDITVHIEVPELDATVRANADSLHRVILNVLCHAIAASDDQDTVRVSVLRRPGRCRLVVTDHGPALQASEVDALLEPFAQRDTGSVSTGLGLAVSHALVAQMGGTTRVWSTAEQGCSVEVELPRWPDQPSEANGPAAGATGAGTAPDTAAAPTLAALTLPAGSGPVRVLYVEDDRLNSLLVKSALEELQDCTVEFAETSTEAWSIIESKRPDVVLSDLNLPGGGGLALVRRVRADPSLAAIVCIAISADAGAQDAAMHAGFDRYWSKPVDLHTMLDTMRRLCRQRVPAA